MILKINGETQGEKMESIMDYLQQNGIDTPAEVTEFYNSLDPESLKEVSNVVMDFLKDFFSEAMDFVTWFI